ncbi:MAG: folate-binding protein [Thioalkalispiraceae bacterium]|jgi:hypothetical protein
MQNEWQTFLEQQGGKIDSQGVLHFANDTKQDIALVGKQCLMTALNHLGIIHVSGEDAQAFLQAQLSNDITLVTHDKSQISAYCNPKGRMLAQFLIIPATDSYFLVLPATILEKTLMRLRMFVLRSQVQLEDVSDRYVCLGLISDDIADLDIPLPENDYDLINNKDRYFTKIPASPSRYLVLASIAQAKTLWQMLASGCQGVSAHSWHWLDIQSGLPTVLKETVEEFVPQMLNLELIGGVNFKKGCYPGQEIVARMHYLGKPKRRMYKLHTNSEDLPVPGENLYLREGDGQSVGKVVLAEPSVDQGTDLLAVLRVNHAGSDALSLGSADGPLVEFKELPYNLESE